MSLTEIILITLAGVGAGAINSLVGSGTLITFPTLVTLGFPPVTATMSNAVGLVAGGVSGTWAYRRELTGQWDQFFQDVLDYCRDVTERAGEDARRQRLSFWGTLALMRCVASSPAAAVQALNTHLLAEQVDNAPEEVLQTLRRSRHRRVHGQLQDRHEHQPQTPAEGGAPPVAQGTQDQGGHLRDGRRNRVPDATGHGGHD